MYCTQADLVEAYGEQDIRLLSDRVNKPPIAIDAVVVARAISDAVGEIDLHLDARYPLPLANVPTTIKRICCTLAYRNLHTRIGDDSPAELAAKRQRELLRGIARGELSLGVDTAGAPVPTNDTVQVSPGRNDWADRY